MKMRFSRPMFLLMLLLAACQSQQSLQVQNPGLHALGMDTGSAPIQIEWTNDISGSTQTVMARVVDGKIVYQGEILRDVQGGEVEAQAAIVTTRKWTSNTVPYVINASTNTQSQVQQAVSYFNANTNLRWVPRTTQTDYVQFVNSSSGCWSYVGRIGGRQQIGLGSNGCGLGGALHEMGHALGFHHEQSRPDRNTYVRIRFDLIPDNIEDNWAIETESQGFGPYDYYSIMHYSLYYGSQKVIEVLQAGVDQSRIGNGTTLTATDISAVNALYPGGTTPPPLPPTPSGETFSGSFTGQGLSNYHPGTAGFSYSGGTIRGTLSGPANTDFDLYLQRLGSGRWGTVARSIGNTSRESINYSAGAGTYRWRVHSYSGSGSYTLAVQK
jgi:hypothetical protein